MASATDGRIALWSMPVCPNLHEASSIDHMPPISYAKYSFSIHQSSIEAIAIFPLLSFHKPDDQGLTFFHLIFTGGDDNALAITILRMSFSGSVVGPQIAAQAQSSHSSLVIPRAHAASITAIALLPDGGFEAAGSVSSSRYQGENAQSAPERTAKWRIVTASNDQQVKIWDVALRDPKLWPSADALDVRRVGSFFTPVADVADIKVLNEDCGTKECGGVQDPAERYAVDTGGGKKVLNRKNVSVVICGVGIDIRRVALE